MASRSNDIIEIELDDRLVYMRKNYIVTIQALWRGALVRKRLQHVMKAYNEIFEEIEGESGLHVLWPCRVIHRPVFLKTYDYMKEKEKQALEKEQKEQQNRKLSNPVTDSDSAILNKRLDTFQQQIQPMGTFAKSAPTNADYFSVNRSIHRSGESAISENVDSVSNHETHCSRSELESDVQNRVEEIVNSSKSSDRQYEEHQTEFEELFPVRDIAHKARGIENEQLSINSENSKECMDKGFNEHSKTSTQNVNLECLENQSNDELSLSGSLEKSPEIKERTVEICKPVSSKTSPASSRHSSARSHRKTAEPDVNVTAAVGERKELWDCTGIEQQLKRLSKTELMEERRAIAMELLWIQQAIDSRKQYLHLKTQVTG